MQNYISFILCFKARTETMGNGLRDALNVRGKVFLNQFSKNYS